jgi:cytoskeletal protein RodZ
MLEHGVLESSVLDSPAMNFEGDAPAIRTNAVDRSLKLSARRSGAYRWSLRPGIAALALLLAIGTTWFLTRSTTTSSPQLATHSTPSVSPQTAPASEPATTANKTPSAPIEQYASATTTPTKPGVREVIRYVQVPAKHGAQPAAPIAQNAPATSTAQQEQPEANDPAAIMISHRYAKILGAEEKHEIVVSSQDRL